MEKLVNIYNKENTKTPPSLNTHPSPITNQIMLNNVVNELFVRAIESKKWLEWRSCSNEVWQQLTITAEKFLQYAQSETAQKHVEQDYTLYFCKNKKEKLKIYVIENEPFDKGSTAYVHGGYQLNGKERDSLKEIILKCPRVSKKSLNAVYENLLNFYESQNIFRSNKAVEKEAKTKIIQQISKDFLFEQQSLETIYEDYKTLIGIQKKFLSFELDQTCHLVTKRFQRSLIDGFKFSFSQKIESSIQLTLGVQHLYKKNHVIFDIKPDNIAYTMKPFSTVHIDLNPHNKAAIQDVIEKNFLTHRQPIGTTTPEYIHLEDLKKLSECLILYKQDKEQALERYMCICQSIMVFQIALIHLTIHTGRPLCQERDLATTSSIEMPAIGLDNTEIERRVNVSFEERKIKRPKYSKSLETLWKLMLRALKTHWEERPSIDEVLKELYVVEELNNQNKRKNQAPNSSLKKTKVVIGN